MYYRDPDGNFVEMQIDAFADPDAATAYMRGPEYAADAVGPAFDPEEMLRLRRSGSTAEELSTRAWCLGAGLPDPLAVLTGSPSVSRRTRPGEPARDPVQGGRGAAAPPTRGVP